MEVTTAEAIRHGQLEVHENVEGRSGQNGGVAMSFEEVWLLFLTMGLR